MFIGLRYMLGDSLELHRLKKYDVTSTTSNYHDVHENEFEYKNLENEIPKTLPINVKVLASE